MSGSRGVRGYTRASTALGRGRCVAKRVCMPFKKILSPTDFSPGSERALRACIRVATQTGAEVVVAHSWYVPPSAYSPQYVYPPFLAQDIVEEAQYSLDTAVRTVRDAGIKDVSGVLLTGPASKEIVELLEKERFDLCVIGTQGRTGFARVMLGSVAEKVVRHAPCSVLAVHAGGEVRPFAHILVPTDLSPGAEHAADMAAQLVAPDGQITLLHVVDVLVPFTVEVRLVGLQADLDKRGAEAVERAAEALRRKTSARVAARSLSGPPSSRTLEILDADSTIDLVVMGSEGRTGIKRVLLGSVAEKAVRHARCPVLVARLRS